MLKLKNITKSYIVNKREKKVLDNINIEFDDNKLIFILGPSGAGKSTLLNIILGNITNYSGEIWIDDICINKFKKKEIDMYRTNIVSNIFQEYNLIEYMSVIDNIKIGCNGKVKNEEIEKVLKELKIDNLKNILVNKLSGGERQRVAIARCIMRKTKIILADEPTGSLDQDNGINIMEILKKLANDHLVIVVSHDSNLADKYADKIINICDGRCTENNLLNNISNNSKNILVKKKNNYFKLVKFAIKNLWLKYIRTIFISLAMSLGFISLFLVVNLYCNFNKQLDELKERIVKLYPITVVNYEYEKEEGNVNKEKDIGYNNKKIYSNVITTDYLKYLNTIEEIKYINYSYDTLLPFVTDKYNLVNNSYIKFITNNDYINDNYDLVYGDNISGEYDVLLKIDSNNNVNSELLNYFDIDDDVEYQDIVGRKIRFIINNDYFIKNDKYYVISDKYDKMYNDSSIELKIVGIVKEREIYDDNNYLYLNSKLLDEVFKINSESDIVLDMLNDNDKDGMLIYLGYNSLPNKLEIYTNNIDDRDIIKRKLDEYNIGNEKILYMDTMMESLDIVKKFVLVISIILALFSLISFVVSGIFIVMLTSIRVLERKHEIGIIRSLGYSIREVKNIFSIENMIICLITSLIGLIVIILLVNPLNNLVYKYVYIDDLFNIDYMVLFLVFIFNLIIIKVSEIFSINRINKLDIVDCLKSR